MDTVQGDGDLVLGDPGGFNGVTLSGNTVHGHDLTQVNLKEKHVEMSMCIKIESDKTCIILHSE